MLKKILIAMFLTSAVAFAPVAAWAQAETPEAAPTEMAPAKTHNHHHHHHHHHDHHHHHHHHHHHKG